MADVSQETTGLRDKIAQIILSFEVWATLDDVCRSLGFNIIENSGNLGKANYLRKIVSEASESTIISAAQKMLFNYPGTRGKPSDGDLQDIQDALWWIDNQGDQGISSVTRYRIVESLEGVRFWGRSSLRDIFTSTIPRTNGEIFPEIGSDGNLYRGLSNALFDILLTGSQNIPSKSSSRVSVREFFKEFGLIKWPDKRFCLVIERIVHPEIQMPAEQKKLVERFNALLQLDGFELHQENLQSGSPVYKIQRKNLGVSGVPKYIIFAWSGPKPDIVIRDAINMDIGVVDSPNQCLVYDEPPPNGDLTWELLLEWWGKKKSSDSKNENFRRDFGLRLRESLQSEPEKILFNTYFKEFKPIMGDNLPALLPQVYLHYDPRNQKEREQPVIVRQRMDFLLLLRNSVRIVIEIDGEQHYSIDGHASTKKYAEMVAEDRRIKLLGYEVYRFGGAEFSPTSIGQQNVKAFFEALFRRYII